MADKKITALTDLGRAIPTYLGLDGTPQTITGSTAPNVTASITLLDGASFSSNATGTLADGTNGQIKIIIMSTAPSSNRTYTLTVTNWGSTGTANNQILFNARGEAVVCVFTNSKWYLVSNYNATIS